MRGQGKCSRWPESVFTIASICTAQIYSKLLFENRERNKLSDALNTSIQDELKSEDPEIMRRELIQKLDNKNVSATLLPSAIAMMHLYNSTNRQAERDKWALKIKGLVDEYGDVMLLDEKYEFWKIFRTKFDDTHVFIVLNSLVNFLNKYDPGSYGTSVILSAFMQLGKYPEVNNKFSNKNQYLNLVIIARDLAFDTKMSDFKRVYALRGLYGLSSEAFAVVSAKLIVSGKINKYMERRIFKMLKKSIKAGRFPRIDTIPRNITETELELWLGLAYETEHKWLEQNLASFR